MDRTGHPGCSRKRPLEQILFRLLLKQAGIQGNARSGRRSLAVYLARQGKDPAIVAKAF